MNRNKRNLENAKKNLREIEQKLNDSYGNNMSPEVQIEIFKDLQNAIYYLNKLRMD